VTTADYPFIDGLRIASVIVGFVLIVLLIVLISQRRLSTNQPGDRLWLSGLVVFIIFAALHEALQVGHRFYILWLPLLAAGEILIGLALLTRLRSDVRALSNP
jgi:hypothetical protein